MATVVGQHQVSAFTAPVAGGPRTAGPVKANDDALRAVINAHDADTGIHVQSGAVGSRPAAGTAGTVWVSTDTGAKYFYLDDGAAWGDLSYAKLTGAAFTGGITGTTLSLSSTLSVTGASTLAAISCTTIAATTIAGSTGTFTGLVTAQAGITVTGAKLTAAATVAGYASINLPHGTAPSSPADGDVWTTTAAVFARVNGATQTLAALNTSSQLVNTSNQTSWLTTASATPGAGTVVSTLSWGAGTAVGEGIYNAGNPTRVALPATGTFLITLYLQGSVGFSAGNTVAVNGAGGSAGLTTVNSDPWTIDIGASAALAYREFVIVGDKGGAAYFEVDVTTTAAQTVNATLSIRRLV